MLLLLLLLLFLPRQPSIVAFGALRAAAAALAPTRRQSPSPHSSSRVQIAERRAFCADKVDCWCCGILLYIAMMGRPPIDARTASTRGAVECALAKPEVRARCGAAIYGLIVDLLSYEPSARPPASVMLSRMRCADAGSAVVATEARASLAAAVAPPAPPPPEPCALEHAAGPPDGAAGVSSCEPAGGGAPPGIIPPDASAAAVAAVSADDDRGAAAAAVATVGRVKRMRSAHAEAGPDARVARLGGASGDSDSDDEFVLGPTL
jgi:hypothetical protein